MTTKEFIKKLLDLGYEVEEEYGNAYGYVYLNVINDNGEMSATVNKSESYLMDTNYTGFLMLNNKAKKELLSILIEYANTPIEKREESKLYYLKLKKIPLGWNQKRCYLNFIPGLEMMDIDDNIEFATWKTKFTKDQIMEMDKRYDVLEDYEMIEVTNDN